jgi:hypothetical protein
MRSGVRLDSTFGLLALGVALAAFGLWRLTRGERTGWFLIAAGALAAAGAWSRIGHPPEPPED